MTPIAHIAGIACLAVLSLPAFGAEDYSRLKVIDTTEMDIKAGPGLSAVLLSPDGTRALQIDGMNFCLLAPAEIGPWAELSCARGSRDLLFGSVEDMLWSPDGTQLLTPTYARAFERFQDTDVQLLDPATLALTDLTDDRADGSLLHDHTPANLDIVSRWLDDETIAFIRYSIPGDGFSQRSGPWLMTVSASGGEAKRISKPLSPNGMVYTLAVAPDGKRIAYAVDDRNDAKSAGIFLTDVDGAAPRRIATMASLPAPPLGLAFSADGNYLMSVTSTSANTGIVANVINLESGDVISVGDGQTITGAAWSPSGSALAYLVYDRDKPANPGGMFIANSPGAPGRLLVGGALMPPVCCGKLPFTWAANQTMLLSRIDTGGTKVLYVRLGG